MAMATSGDPPTLGTAARGGREPDQSLGEKTLGPAADHNPLDANRLCCLAVRAPGFQRTENLPPGEPILWW
jgi:hypothetical protein